MKTIHHRLKWTWIEVLNAIVLGLVLSSSSIAVADDASINPQAATPAAVIPANASPELAEFLQNRATLAGKLAALNTSNSQALEQFQQQNADLLKRQAQLAQIISEQQTTALPTPPPLQMPPQASARLKAYLAARDVLMRDEVAFTNQHLSDAPAVREAVIQQWHIQNAARIQNVQQLAQAVSAQQETTALPTPPPLQIPSNVSPQLQAYLTARDQLMRDEVAFTNQHLSDDSATRQAAIQQWHTQNAARIQSLQQLAQTASVSNEKE